MSCSTVKECLLKAKQAGLSWPLLDELDDAGIEHLLFPAKSAGTCSQDQMHSMEYLYHELRRKSVTLQLAWYE